MLKNYYVRLLRWVKCTLDWCGVTKWLDAHSSKRSVLYCRSLLSIYDVEDMFKVGLPWWSFKAIDKVEEMLEGLNGEARVFEYGAGASTVWLASRAGEIHSVEHDRLFHQTILEPMSRLKNVTCHLVVPEKASDRAGELMSRSNRKGYEQMNFYSYVQSIHAIEGKFDLIIIDGRARISCLSEALKKLKPEGVLLFDNSERAEYLSGLSAVQLERNSLKGLTPSLPYRSETTLFYNNSMG